MGSDGLRLGSLGVDAAAAFVNGNGDTAFDEAEPLLPTATSTSTPIFTPVSSKAGLCLILTTISIVNRLLDSRYIGRCHGGTEGYASWGWIASTFELS